MSTHFAARTRLYWPPLSWSSLHQQLKASSEERSKFHGRLHQRLFASKGGISYLYLLHFILCVLPLSPARFPFPLYLLDRWSGNNWEHPNFPFAGTTGRIAWAYEGQIACPMDAKNVTAPYFRFDGLGIIKRPLLQITYKLQRSPKQSIRTDSHSFTAQIV